MTQHSFLCQRRKGSRERERDWSGATSSIQHLPHPASHTHPPSFSIRLSVSLIHHSTPNILHPASNIPLTQHPSFSILHPASNILHPASLIQYPSSGIPYSTSFIQNPSFSVSRILESVLEGIGGSCNQKQPYAVVKKSWGHTPKLRVTSMLIFVTNGQWVC